MREKYLERREQKRACNPIWQRLRSYYDLIRAIERAERQAFMDRLYYVMERW
jgi:hypothetical protein